MTGSLCSVTHCQRVKSFWERQIRSVLNHKQCDDTFKAVKNTLQQSLYYIHSLQPLFSSSPNRHWTPYSQILKPKSSAIALKLCTRYIITFHPASAAPNPICSKCLKGHLSFRKSNYFRATDMHFIDNFNLVEFIIQSLKHGFLYRYILFVWSLSTMRLSPYFITEIK